MRTTELLRLVWMNINQNKFKTILTSIGIVVGAATIVLVIGIGQGGQQEIAEQFAQLNAGAIDVSYEYEGEEEGTGGFSFGNIGQFFGNFFGGTGRKAGMGTAGSSGENGTSGTATMPGGGFPMGENGAAGGSPTGENGAAGGSSTGENGSVGGFSTGENGTAGIAPFGENGNMGGFGRWENADGTGNAAQEGSDSRRGRPEDDSDGDSQVPEGADGSGGIENAPDADSTDGEEDQEETEQETSLVDSRLNQERLILTQEDVEDIERYVTGITGATISYSTRSSVEGGSLTSAQTYTVAGVKEDFLEVSKLSMEEGDFLLETEDLLKERVCVLGTSAAKEIFGSTADALGSTVYIDDRTYKVSGILASSQTVSAGVSPDTAILVPYETGIKYITGTEIDPVVTVVAQDVNCLDQVIQDVRTVLEEAHVNARFTFEDSGSKMQAAQASNRTLTMLLSAMAAIVFLVGGIGIMNVLFVSVKERTNEIGILKAIGTSQGDILAEFLIEAAAVSLIGGMLGVLLSFAVIPAAERLGVRVEAGLTACLTALCFAVLTGTIFGIYPAWKASRLEPVDALNAE